MPGAGADRRPRPGDPRRRLARHRRGVQAGDRAAGRDGALRPRHVPRRRRNRGAAARLHRRGGQTDIDRGAGRAPSAATMPLTNTTFWASGKVVASAAALRCRRTSADWAAAPTVASSSSARRRSAAGVRRRQIGVAGGQRGRVGQHVHGEGCARSGLRPIAFDSNKIQTRRAGSANAIDIVYVKYTGQRQGRQTPAQPPPASPMPRTT